MPNGLTRREFVRCAALSVAGALVACGEDPVPALREQAHRLGASLDCSDLTMLQPAEAATRADNQYRQHSEKETEFCLHCLNYVPPADEAACGTCKTVRGPINPDGWCKQWTKPRG